ncbi:MAG: S8 family peptidase [Rubrivivax sp.]|nr:S8 family peptidase [Rubrivivax sp.]
MAQPNTPLRSLNSRMLTGGPRWKAVPLCASLALLAACGGADDTPGTPTTAAPVDTAVATPERRFVLWAPGREATVQAEQAAISGDASGSEVRLVVRMNPAAVQPTGRATMAGSSGGESGDAAAQRARDLAAKADAVVSASNDVMALSIRNLAPTALVRQHYAHALEGFVVSVPWSQAQAVADELARNPAVDAVELDRALAIEQASTARTLDARAWGVDRLDQRARAFDNLFRHTRTGQGVTAYVVDTGVSAHNQFGTRLRAGFSTVNDGQGTRDCHGHGTHVAGTVAGQTLGVAPGASIVPVRVLDCRGSGASTGVLAGLDWIAANGTRPAVVNMSLGGPAFTSLDAAAQRLVASGYTVVAAAGNSNIDACTQSPGRATGLVTVAASDNADAKASFSNTGACVALWAPGTNIASAGIASATAVVAMNGTSMAAPHAAGAAALLLQAQPTATAAQVRTRLLQDATPNLVLGVTGSTTRAMLFAGEASATTPTPPPPPPANVAVRPASITLSTAVPAVGLWTTTATVQVLNAQGAAVAGARVAGRFSHMTAEVSCTTAANGRCSITSAAAPWGAMPKIGFAVTALSGTNMADAGNGVRHAQAVQPAAPVATVSALTGTMVRPAANSAQWTPNFNVTLTDAQRAPVAGALVQAQLTIHSGSRAVGLQTVACQTAANGQCRLVWTGPTLGSAHTGAVLDVKAVSRPYLAYTPGALTRATVGTVR